MDEQTPPGAQSRDAFERPGPTGPDANISAGTAGPEAGPKVPPVFDQAGERVPEEWEIEGPAVSISLGDAADLDPALLAAMIGPDGLGGQSLGPQFGQDCTADALRPGPVLAALTEQAVASATALTDDQLTGVLQAARRIENRSVWQQTMVIAELARRRQAQYEDARVRKIPQGCRPGEYTADELAAELLITRRQAEYRIDNDVHLTARLPATLAGMAAGLISGDRADVIAFYTTSLGDADTAYADEVLAAVAPGLRVDQLARRAAALEMKLDPEVSKARKEITKATRQRVEAGREQSGNAYLAGREMETAEVLAGKAHIDAIAARLRRAGLDGNLDQLRVRAFADLIQGRDPLDRITPAPRPTRGSTPDSNPADSGPADSGPMNSGPAGSSPADSGTGPDQPSGSGPAATDPDLDFDPDPESHLAPPPAPGPPAPLPALINLIVPIGTYLGYSTAAAQAGGYGLLDSEDTQAIVQAASRHPRTRWSATIVGPDGTAIAHGSSPGQHPQRSQSPQSPQTPYSPGAPPSGPPPSGPPPSGTSPPRAPGQSRGAPAPDPRPDPGPDAVQAARLRELLRQLNITPEPIARETCDHHHAEDRYTPSRKLKQLVRVRTATCSAPGCNAQAVYCDLDHVTPWPNGLTCECNLHPACRRHHRCKQAPDWQAEQPEPGVMRWITPAGRVYTTCPTTYDT